MPQTCCVPMCDGMGGFRFPKDPSLRLKWRVAIKRVDQNNRTKLWEPWPTATVCEKHFKPGLLCRLFCTVESHINESHIKNNSHINDVQAAYQLLYVLGSSHIKNKSHINDVFAADGLHCSCEILLYWFFVLF